MEPAVSIRVKVKRKGDPNDAGKWLSVVAGTTFDAFLLACSTKLGFKVSAVFDADNAEFDDTDTFREGDILYASGDRNTPEAASMATGAHPATASSDQEQKQSLEYFIENQAKTNFQPSTIVAASLLTSAARKEAPGPAPRLIIGNLLDLLPSAVPAARRLYRQYGGIVKLTLFGKNVFVITDPAYLPQIYELTNKRLPPQELAGQGMFLADGPTWKLARQTLAPYFTVKYINEFVPLFIDKTRHLIQEAEKLPVTQPIDVMEAMTKLAFESICSAGFTYDVKMLDKGLLSDDEPPFISAFQYSFEKQKNRMFRLQFFNKIPTISNIKFWNSIDRLNASVDEIIDSHTQARAPSGCPMHNKDLLTLMMEAKNPETGETLSRENIREQCITLLVAGHKTTTLLSGWFLYCLSQNPDVEEKLIKELESIFGTDQNRPPTADELKRMHYLDQCLRETLRMYPPAQSNLRGTDVEMNIDGYHIPANSNFMVNLWDVHRHPKYWSNPDEFDPDRFTPENMVKMHPYQWIPFGSGPRTCIGMPFALTETKVALCMMLRKFSFQMAPGETVTVGPNPLKPLTGVKMIWNRRTWMAAAPSPKSAAEKSGSGHKKHKSSKKPAVQSIPEEQWATLFKGKPVPVTILVGSNQGQSQTFADTLAAELELNNFTPDVYSADSYPDFKNLANAPVVIVISSTYNGLAPDNAEKFTEWLNQRDLPAKLLESTRFSVFGCGNKQWHTTFQKIPRLIHARLSDLGGEALLELCQGDECGDMETQFVAWKDELITILCDEFQRVPATLTASSASAAPAAVAKFKPHFNAKFVSAPESEGKTKSVSHLDRTFKKFKVLVNRELQDPQSERSTRHIELRIPRTKGTQGRKNIDFSYKSGDHFAVLPDQPKDLVEAFAKRLGLDLDAYFVLQPASLKSSIKQPTWSKKPMTVRRYLTTMADLSSAPTRKQLEIFATLASDPAEAQLLTDLSNTFASSVKRYEELVIKPALTLPELLNTLGKSVKLSFAHAVEMLNAPKPRFYSISSSPKLSPESVHLTVGVAEFDAAGQKRYGLCSSYLASLKPGTRVFGSIKACPTFRLPSPATQTPVICIGAGTGVAPFRAFLQERAAEFQEGDTNLLIFGCRNEHDYIYRDEWDQLRAAKKARIEAVFSRVGERKEYVQNRMKTIGNDVFELLDKKNAVIYVCGDGRNMARDVTKALLELVGFHGSLTELEAQTYLDDLISSGRYVQDVWG